MTPSRVTLERLYKTLNLLYGFVKDWNYWNAMRDRSERAEEYSEGNISVHYHFRVRPEYLGHPQAQEFCARFNRLSRSQLRNEFYSAANLSDPDSPYPNMYRREGDGYVFVRNSSGPHHQDSGEAKIRESTAGVSRKPSSDCKACGCSSKHLCGLTAWNT